MMASTTNVSAATTSTPSKQPIPEKGLKWIERSGPEKKPSASTGTATQGPPPVSTREGLSFAVKNPLVPFGMFATVCALIMGVKASLKGDRFRQQMMMRYRVGFQGFTIMMLVGGLAAADYFYRDTDEED